MHTTSDRPEELPRRRARPGAIALLIAALALLASACGIQEDAAPSGRVPTPRSEKGIWLSQAEIAALPTSGPAWDDVVEAASGSLGAPSIADQDSDHDVRTLAAALVAARTGDRAARQKAVSAIEGAMGTERGARTLAVGRNLQSYVIAADVVDLQAVNAGVGNRFRDWLRAVRTQEFDGKTLVQTSNERPNNWGTHATASLTAVAAYLNDRGELDRLSKVFRGWTGDRRAYAGFKFGDLAWQANPAAPVGVNPDGVKSVAGHDLGGALPEEMRRGGGLRWPPADTGYPWGALNGAVVTAELLSRQGYDAWGWSDEAVARAVGFLDGLGWAPGNDDEWVLPLVNARYGTKYAAAASVGLGKNLGFTNWTHGASSPG
ncbi:MAG TPA: alginate lyase family protein [Acidimicrobiales bacterium]|nr:alginate lyase family protein [Acidimicrobiales bacterium]